MPKALLLEFRNDDSAVARKGEAPLTQIAKDFGISEACLHRPLKRAEVEDSVRPSITTDEAAEIRELRKRNRCWSRRTSSGVGRRRFSLVSRSQNDVPAGPGTRCPRERNHADLPGARVLQAGALYVAGHPVTDREWDDMHPINTARDIHADDPAFGYRFIADQLAERGIKASENRVQRLCQQEQIWSVFARKGRALTTGRATRPR